MTGSSEKGMRTCIGCGAKRPKASMVRIVRTPEGAVQVDPGGKAPGRGAYVCSPECLRTAQRKSKLARALRMRVDDDTATAVACELEKASCDVVAR